MAIGECHFLTEAIFFYESLTFSENWIEIIKGNFPCLDGRAEGIYLYEPHNAFKFEVGPYSTHHWWRNRMCLTFYKMDFGTFLRRSKEFVGQPFYELLWFSDFEGAIGAETSAKLFHDFVTCEETARESDEGRFF